MDTTYILEKLRIVTSQCSELVDFLGITPWFYLFVALTPLGSAGINRVILAMKELSGEFTLPPPKRDLTLRRPAFELAMWLASYVFQTFLLAVSFVTIYSFGRIITGVSYWWMGTSYFIATYLVSYVNHCREHVRDFGGKPSWQLNPWQVSLVVLSVVLYVSLISELNDNELEDLRPKYVLSESQELGGYELTVPASYKHRYEHGRNYFDLTPTFGDVPDGWFPNREWKNSLSFAVFTDDSQDLHKMANECSTSPFGTSAVFQITWNRNEEPKKLLIYRVERAWNFKDGKIVQTTSFVPSRIHHFDKSVIRTTSFSF